MSCHRFICLAAVLLATAASATKLSVGAGTLDCNTPCSASQCSVQKCDASVPYACVGGAASGGCSTTPAHFQNTTQCTACCKITSCAIQCSVCTAAQCNNNPCGPTVPYLCTSGADNNGCAANWTAWRLNPGCHSCCDASACGTEAPAPPSPPAPPGPVPKIKCHKSCGAKCDDPERCPHDLRWMCIAGNSTGGCSASEKSWEKNPSCTDCCDVRLCPKGKKCGKCDANTCATTQCSATNPYICTSGTLAGGCSPKKHYWPDNVDCSSCCDFNTCPGQ